LSSSSHQEAEEAKWLTLPKLLAGCCGADAQWDAQAFGAATAVAGSWARHRLCQDFSPVPFNILTKLHNCRNGFILSTMCPK